MVLFVKLLAVAASGIGAAFHTKGGTKVALAVGGATSGLRGLVARMLGHLDARLNRCARIGNSSTCWGDQVMRYRMSRFIGGIGVNLTTRFTVSDISFRLSDDM